MIHHGGHKSHVVYTSAIPEGSVTYDFSAATLAASFPLIKALWHEDDFDVGNKWVIDRVNSCKMSGAAAVADVSGFRLGTINDGSVVLDKNIDLSGKNYCAMVHFGIEPKWAIGDDWSFTTEPSVELSCSGASYALLTTNAADYLLTDSVVGAFVSPQTVIGWAIDIAAQDVTMRLSRADGALKETVAKNAAGSAGTVATPLINDLLGKHTGSAARRTKIMMLLATDTDIFTDIVTAVDYMVSNPGYLYPGWAGVL